MKRIFPFWFSLLFAVPAFSQTQSKWANQQIQYYKNKPDAIQVFCYGWRRWNTRSGISVFSDEMISFSRPYMKVPSYVTNDDIKAFHMWMVPNYCPDVW
jgi:hypothetical protein